MWYNQNFFDSTMCGPQPYLDPGDPPLPVMHTVEMSQILKMKMCKELQQNSWVVQALPGCPSPQYLHQMASGQVPWLLGLF